MGLGPFSFKRSPSKLCDGYQLHRISTYRMPIIFIVYLSIFSQKCKPRLGICWPMHGWPIICASNFKFFNFNIECLIFTERLLNHDISRRSPSLTTCLELQFFNFVSSWRRLKNVGTWTPTILTRELRQPSITMDLGRPSKSMTSYVL